MIGLASSEVLDLERLARTDPDEQVRWRAQCLVVVTRSRTQRDAAQLVKVDPSTLARWRRRFIGQGRDGLADRPRSGRPVKLSAEARQLLTTVLDELPTEHGYATATWTLADLQDLLARRGWVVTQTTVARTLHTLGYRYIRPKHDLQHRHDTDSVATAAKALQLLQKKGDLTAQEFAWSTEMSVTCTPIRTWQSAGKNAGSAS